MVIRPSYSDSAMAIRPSYSDSAILFGFGHGDSAILFGFGHGDSAILFKMARSKSIPAGSSFRWSLLNPGTRLKRDPCKNNVKPDFVKDRRRFKREYDAFHTGTLVALRKKRGSLKNSFCQVKNEKGLVSMHDLSSFTTTRIVVVNYGSNYPNCMLVSVF